MYICFFFFKLLFYFSCSQIWLNLLVDHHLFGYNTKLPPTQKKKHYAATENLSVLHNISIVFFCQFCDVAKMTIIHKKILAKFDTYESKLCKKHPCSKFFGAKKI